MTKNKRRNGLKPFIPELLAPAGNLEKLKTALHYGADAVYLGGKELSLRAKAGNFTLEDMEKAVSYAHAKDKKVYVTVNILAHNNDLDDLENHLQNLANLEVDGLIVSDPGILQIARNHVPGIPLHLSTQANVTNYAAAQFWLQQGTERLNLARELSMKEIDEIRRKVDCELEVFVHGALCISYSGRCMLSNYLTNRDANKGECSHPCRFNYAVIEEKRPGQYYPVEEDERGTYIFNSKDLCLLMLLPELVATGVDSLKIEGRMKSIFYVGGVVRIYRAALDYLAELSEEEWQNPSAITLPEIFLDEIQKTGTRGITANFFKEKPTQEDMLYHSSRAVQVVEPVAVIRKIADEPLVEIRNRVENGERLEYMGKGLQNQAVLLKEMKSLEGERVTAANPGNMLTITTDPPLKNIEVHGIMRRTKVDS